jgi:D-alanyl-D-alanine carboxypeptidase
VAVPPRVPGAVTDLSSFLEPFQKRAGLPAIAAEVWKGGELVASGVTGVRKSHDSTRATMEDQWHLGSNTKAMTATLVGLLIDRGQLHWDDTLANLFRGETVASGYADVTLRELLQHRGGAPANPPLSVILRMMWDGEDGGARLRAVRAVLASPPAGKRGKFVYANTGYMILGAVLERVTGATWEELMKRELFDPLKMSSCGFGAPGIGDRAMGPAGRVHCSLADWGKFLRMHLAGERGETTLLSPETIALLHAPPEKGHYAAGWVVGKPAWADFDGFWHNGSNTRWYALAWIAPEENLVVAVATNRFGDATTAQVEATVRPLARAFAGE